MKTTVIYHSADFDGIFCREIAKKFLPAAELIGWDYKDEKISFPTTGRVYVLDLSPECFQESTMPNPDELKERLVWIDHHKTAIDRWNAAVPGYRIDGVAACRLAWQWFATLDKNTGCPEAPVDSKTASVIFPAKEHFLDRLVTEPLAVRLAGEYDIWDKRDPDAELFQMGLRSQKLDSIWELILQNPTAPVGERRGIDEITVEALLDNGQGIQFFQREQNESIIKAAGFDIEFEGLKMLACNNARYNSHLFAAGLRPEHEACFGFAWRDGQWAVSLYHAPGKEHHDLSVIATKYGGGGHRGACGFKTENLPFLTAKN